MKGLEGKKIGNCELKEEIGSGNFGTVYRGYHYGLKQEVAVKIIKQELVDNELYLELFQAEAPKMTQFDDYTHIVKVYDAGIENIGDAQCCYIVMEWMKVDLERKINDEPEWLTFDRVQGIMSSICKGVQHIHDNGLLHQDIKLSNIMMKDGKIKIGDFGLAMKRFPLNSEDCVPGGTPEYMAPEVEKGGNPTIRSDIYSLGAVFKKMVSGLNDVPRKEQKVISKVISKATARVPFLRYGSAMKMLNAIEGNKGPILTPLIVILLIICGLGLIFGTVYWGDDLYQSCAPEREYKTQLLKEAIALIPTEPEMALPKLQKAAELSPQDAEVHYQIAEAYIQLEDFEAALPEAEKACTLNKTSEKYRNQLKLLKNALYQED